MADITKVNTNKSTVELHKELTKEGVTIEHIIIDGRKMGIMGSANEKDREAQIAAIQIAVNGSNSPAEAISKLINCATITEKKISPDEQIKIGCKEYMISYKDRKLYTLNGNEVSNLKDLEGLDLTKDQIKNQLLRLAGFDPSKVA